MKKIILAFDGVHFSEGAFEFARRLNELQPILLTGIFLPQAELANLWSYTDGMGGAFIPLLLDEESNEHVEKNINRFQKLCVGNGIDYRVHKDFYDFALPELRKESCYADLLILGSEVFYKSIGTEVPNDYIADALHQVACPVVLYLKNLNFLIVSFWLTMAVKIPCLLSNNLLTCFRN